MPQVTRGNRDRHRTSGVPTLCESLAGSCLRNHSRRSRAGHCNWRGGWESDWPGNCFSADECRGFILATLEASDHRLARFWTPPTRMCRNSPVHRHL